ncbi:MAG: TonB-dependent siderophore receptor [Sphingobium sp.]
MKLGQKGGVLRARRTAVSAVLMATVAVGPMAVTPAAYAQTASERSFSIQPQSLADALVAFANQSGYQVTTNGAEIRGVRTNGVNGTFPSFDALSHLLIGTGFTYRINGTLVTIERVPQSADDAITLGPVRVEGESGGRYSGVTTSLTSDPAATEGVNTYTATGPSLSATGLALTLRETPQSVTVVTRQKMDDFGLETLYEVMDQTPGITMQREGDAVYFYSRGTTTNLRIDGIRQITSGWAYLSTTIYGMGDMAEIDRVEVLKGASGLMNGDGSYGGMINLIRKKPTREFQASIRGSAGRWNNYRGDVDVSGPLNADQTLRARTVVAWRNADSFRDHQKGEYFTFYGTVDMEPTPDTLVNVGVSFKRQEEQGGASANPVMLYSDDGTFMGLQKRSFNIGAPWAGYKQDELAVFGSVEQKLGQGWVAKLQVGHEQIERPKSIFGSFSYYDKNNSSNSQYKDIRQINEHLTFDVKGPLELLGRTHDLLIGAGASRSRTRLLRGDSVSSRLTALGISYADGGGALPYPDDIDDRSYASEFWSTKRQYVYAAGRFDLADPLKLIAGVRFSNYDQNNQTAWESTVRRERGIFTPYAGVTLDVLKSLSLYASYASIFQPQSVRDVNGNTLPPEEGITYEVGVKGEFFAGQLNVSANYFWLNTDNAAEATRDIVTGTPDETAYRAVMGAKRSGYEIEASGRLLPGWQIQGGYVLNYDTLNNASSVVARPRPKRQIKLNSSYRFEEGRLAGLSFGGGTRWQSDISTQDSGNIIEQKNFWLFDGFARYETGKFTFGVNVDNIFDKKYFSSVGNQWSLLYTWGQPRNVKLSAGYKF